jgi:hypothetical protein
MTAIAREAAGTIAVAHRASSSTASVAARHRLAQTGGRRHFALHRVARPRRRQWPARSDASLLAGIGWVVVAGRRKWKLALWRGHAVLSSQEM